MDQLPSSEMLEAIQLIDKFYFMADENHCHIHGIIPLFPVVSHLDPLHTLFQF
jgi:hypothetical protein